MGQPEIYEWLNARDGWYTVRDIAKSLNLCYSAVAISMRKLRKDKLVDWQRGLGPNKKGYIYARRCHP